jgi:putative phosphoribosyl transferase
MRQPLTGQFRDRSDAGRVLSEYLLVYRDNPQVLVLGLPRGGVPVAYEVAQALRASLDVFLVRKLGVPNQPELAMGAIASGGIRVLNQGVIRELEISRSMIETVAAHESSELQRRERTYRGMRPMPKIEGRDVILIDDGLATGSTMRAAIASLRQHNPGRIVVASPVGARNTCDELRKEVDEIVCAHTPEPFVAVGRWYRDFSPIMDREIRDLLEQAEVEVMAR